MHVRGVLTRQLVPAREFDAAVEFYERMLDQPARLRFDYPEKALRIAQVGQILVIGGDDNAVQAVRETAMTFLVDDIEGYASHLPTVGAEIVRNITRVPSGRNMLVRHGDGVLVEYVEHDRPNPADDTLAPRS